MAAGPDLALREMRRFTRAALSDDPTSGLTGVLAGTGGRIASACEGLAELTERTRARIVDTVTRYAAQEQWYHPVADVVDQALAAGKTAGYSLRSPLPIHHSHQTLDEIPAHALAGLGALAHERDKGV